MTLSSLKAQLQRKLGPPESIPFWAVNTRLFLRTGVNLKEINPQDDTKPELVENVRKALADLGHPF